MSSVANFTLKTSVINCCSYSLWIIQQKLLDIISCKNFKNAQIFMLKKQNFKDCLNKLIKVQYNPIK